MFHFDMEVVHTVGFVCVDLHLHDDDKIKLEILPLLPQIKALLEAGDWGGCILLSSMLRFTSKGAKKEEQGKQLTMEFVYLLPWNQNNYISNITKI